MLAVRTPRNPSDEAGTRKLACGLHSAAGNTGDAPVRISRRDDRFDPPGEEIEAGSNPKIQRPERPARTGKKGERQFDSRDNAPPNLPMKSTM